MNVKILNILVFMVIEHVSSQRIPTNPCPEIFSYYKDTNGVVYGEVSIPYDKSTRMEFNLNSSIAATFDRKVELKLVLVTTEIELATAQRVIYNVFFPTQEIIPKITEITYNGKIYCRGPDEPQSQNKFRTSYEQYTRKIPLELNRTGSFGYCEWNRNNDVVPSVGVTNTWSSTVFKYTERKPVFVDPGISYSELPVKDPDDRRTVLQTPVRIQSTSPPQPQTETPGYVTRLSTTNPLMDFFLQPFTEAPMKKNEDFKCGISNNVVVPYIMQGTEVEDGQFPWLTALFARNDQGKYDYKCSGTLISEQHVITAGRCVQYYKVQVLKTEDILLVLGTTDLEQQSSNGAITRKARDVQTHPDFIKNPNSAHADISVITMDLLVAFSNVVRPVCLWKGESDLAPFTNMLGTITGFGQDENALTAGDLYVTKAKYAEIPIVSQADCLLSDIAFNSITSHKTLCAGGKGSGPCIGDSGAGLVLPIDGFYHLRGVTSLSLSINGTCYFQKKYAVYCDVAKFMDWVKACMKE